MENKASESANQTEKALPKEDTNKRFQFLYANSRSVWDFERLHQLGEGTYGTVYCARDKKTNQLLALKKVKIHDKNEGFPLTSLREIKLLTELKKHVNIVELKEVAVGTRHDSIYLVFEYCKVDLATLVDSMSLSHVYFSESEVKCLIYQLMMGLSFMHYNQIMHRDLKLSNLLLNEDGILKIADFGLAREFDSYQMRYTPKVVTLWYRAPEILIGKENYTSAVDIWSVGCLLAELLNKGLPILQGKSEIHQVHLIFELIGSPDRKELDEVPKSLLENLREFRAERENRLRHRFKNFSSSCLDLLESMLEWNPKNRITVNQALVHPYFQEHPRACEPSEIRCLSKLDHYLNVQPEQGRKRVKDS